MSAMLILASHGSLAEGMKTAAEMIMGEEESLLAYGLDRYETPQKIAETVRAQIAAKPDAQPLILCDIKGGSVANELLALCQTGGVRMLTGMNLSMVLEFMTDLDEGISPERVDEVMEIAKGGVCYFDAGVIEKMQQAEREAEDEGF